LVLNSGIGHTQKWTICYLRLNTWRPVKFLEVRDDNRSQTLDFWYGCFK